MSEHELLLAAAIAVAFATNAFYRIIESKGPSEAAGLVSEWRFIGQHAQSYHPGYQLVVPLPIAVAVAGIWDL